MMFEISPLPHTVRPHIVQQPQFKCFSYVRTLRHLKYYPLEAIPVTFTVSICHISDAVVHGFCIILFLKARMKISSAAK